MEIARLYRQAQNSFVQLCGGLSEEQWATPVPCSPGWTVRDVLSHVAGVTDDVLNQRLEGAASEPWTRAQVERWRDTPVDELIARWNEQIDPVADALEAFGEVRPPFDCHAHEHDVRHALGLPGNRDSEIIATAATRFAGAPVGRPISLVAADGSTIDLGGEGDAITATGVDAFEFVRSRLGRRSRQQVAGYLWEQPIGDAELDAWFLFGPSLDPINE